MLTLQTCVFVTVHLESFSSEIVVVVVVWLVRRSFEFQRLTLLMAGSIMEIETFLHIVRIHLLLIWRRLLFLLMQTFYYLNYIFFEQNDCLLPMYMHSQTVYTNHTCSINRAWNTKPNPIIMMVAFFERSIARLAIYCWMYCLSVYDSCVCIFSSLIFSSNRTLVSHVISFCSTIFRVVSFNCNFFRENILFIHFNACVFFPLSWRRLFIQNSYFINRMRYSCVYCTTHWCFSFVHFVHSRVFLARWISIWWNYLAFFVQPPNVQHVQ